MTHRSRRRFLKYAGMGAVGSAIAACQGRDRIPFLTTAPVDFGRPEKTNLVIGFVPVVDSAPLIIAQEQGFFGRYGLNVTLLKQTSWQLVQQGLLEWRFDAIQSQLSLPLMARFSPKKSSAVALMGLNLNGSAIALHKKFWQDLRPSTAYVNFQEFADAFRLIVRRTSKPLRFGVESTFSLNAYLLRYWLAAMGIDPDREVSLVTLPPSQLSYKLAAGVIEGYCASAPWSQKAVAEKTGFTVYVSRDIWQGHPGNVLATMQPWVDKHPHTAKALLAALLEACQFCEENRQAVTETLARREYLNTPENLIAPSLVGPYSYSQLDQDVAVQQISDFYLFNQETEYLKRPNRASYLWRSHSVWLLTQMLRWHHLPLRDYPDDTDALLAKLYPLSLYQEVAKTLGFALPSSSMKVESAPLFVDRRSFDPRQPVAYLNQFQIRASRPNFIV